jgi:hypothetical protein
VNRVKWFRECATCNGAQEEKEILEEEFRETAKSFECMSTVWNELTVQSRKDMGAAAYASKQSAMYCELAADFSAAFQNAQAVAEPAKSAT